MNDPFEIWTYPREPDAEPELVGTCSHRADAITGAHSIVRLGDQVKVWELRLQGEVFGTRIFDSEADGEREHPEAGKTYLVSFPHPMTGEVMDIGGTANRMFFEEIIKRDPAPQWVIEECYKALDAWDVGDFNRVDQCIARMFDPNQARTGTFFEVWAFGKGEGHRRWATYDDRADALAHARDAVGLGWRARVLRKDEPGRVKCIFDSKTDAAPP